MQSWLKSNDISVDNEHYTREALPLLLFELIFFVGKLEKSRVLKQKE
jgi:hypothetical protein